MVITFVVYSKIEDPILFGGQYARVPIQADEMEKGRRRWGPGGHAARKLADLWGMRGIDFYSGLKKWVLEP